MKIAAVDPFYLKMPHVTDRVDGTQDTFLVRIRADNGLEGWGESDASPLVSLACYCCPMSHGNIINIRESLLGENVDGAADLARIREKVLRQGMDLQQIHHAYSAADIALWDLVGKHLEQPVYRLLDGPQARAWPKLPYASVLFGDTPETTRQVAEGLRRAGFRAAKFGWGPFGRGGRENDLALVRAAREGVGEEASLFVDAGAAWGEDDETAFERATDLAPFRVGWLEEPLGAEAVEAYRRLTARRPPVPIAAGESCGRLREAEDFLRNAGLDYLQIDVGRIGGITPAHQARKWAEARGVAYVNHTFKSPLSVAAAMHVYAAVERFGLLEFPAAGSALSREIVRDPLLPGPEGLVSVRERPGLGVTVDPEALRRYLRPVRIEIDARTVFAQPAP